MGNPVTITVGQQIIVLPPEGSQPPRPPRLEAFVSQNISSINSSLYEARSLLGWVERMKITPSLVGIIPPRALGNYLVDLKLDDQHRRVWEQRPKVSTNIFGVASTDFNPQQTLIEGSYLLIATDSQNPQNKSESILHLYSNQEALQKKWCLVDLDALLAKESPVEVISALKKISEQADTQIVLATINEDPAIYTAREKWLKDNQITLPHLRNTEFRSFNDESQGYDEKMNEWIKRLRAENNIPISIVIGKKTWNDLSHSYDPTNGTPSFYEFQTTVDLTDKFSLLMQTKADTTLYPTSPIAQSAEDYFQKITGATSPCLGEIEWYTDNQTFRKDLISAINQASKQIIIRNFVFYGDDSELNQALKNAKHRGVSVLLYIDRVSYSLYATSEGVKALKEETVQDLESAGINILYNPLPLENRRMDLSARQFGSGPREHAKGILVDGTLFDGGYTLSAIHFNNQKNSDGTNQIIPFNELAKWTGLGMPPYEDLGWKIQNNSINSAWLQSIVTSLSYSGQTSDIVKTALENIGSFAINLSPETLSPISYVQHHTGDLNTTNVYEALLTDPNAKTVVIDNSFVPTDYNLDLMMTAAKRGVKVKWIVGNIFIMPMVADINESILKASNAGVEIYLLGAQRHEKLYMNITSDSDAFEENLKGTMAFGSMNLDGSSMNDHEELFITPLESPAGKILYKNYVTNFLNTAHKLNLEDGKVTNTDDLNQLRKNLSSKYYRMDQIKTAVDQLVITDPTTWELFKKSFDDNYGQIPAAFASAQKMIFGPFIQKFQNDCLSSFEGAKLCYQSLSD